MGTIKTTIVIDEKVWNQLKTQRNGPTYPSNKEVRDRRPKLETSAGETIREMRNEREATYQDPSRPQTVLNR